MNNFLNNFRIPTLLGLTIIAVGIGAGVVLTLRNQNVSTKAAADLLPNPENIKVTNIGDTKVSLSWSTDEPAPNYLKVGIDKADQTKLDDRDLGQVASRKLHHVSLKDLIPGTTYQYKVTAGRSETPTNEFTTAPAKDSTNQFQSIVGAVKDGNSFLGSGLVYLEIPGAIQQSAVIESLGNFIIPLSKMRTTDLSDIFSDEDTAGTILVLGEAGQKATAKIVLSRINVPIGTLAIGEDLDLTLPPASPSALLKFDLNSDGFINASDHSIVLSNFGKNPKVPRADLNGDGLVDKMDVKIISSEIAKLGNQ